MPISTHPALSFYRRLYSFSAGSSQEFQTRPQNVVINEAGTAVFRCVAFEGSEMVTLIGWRITTSGVSTTVNTGVTVSGIGSITVSEDRTNLTLANVSRSVSGATIICHAIGSSTISASATITVQCESLQQLPQHGINVIILMVVFYIVQLHPLLQEVSPSPTLNRSPPMSPGVPQRTMVVIPTH